MTQTEALQRHLGICDGLYELAQEENRFLQQHQRPPEPALLERKRDLLARLDDALTALRATPRTPGKNPALGAALDQGRSRILQILQLDRENEQLLLRFSLNRGIEPAAGAKPVPAGMLQKIYARYG